MRGTKAAQTVRPDGTSIKPLIDGVKVKQSVTQQDGRGTLCEVYQPSWGFDGLPIATCYVVTIRPGQVKGWAVHERQVDRYFFLSGSTKLVLFDGRPDSPTHGMINELFFSECNRSLVTTPPGVYHAVECVGLLDSVMINIPSEPYDYECPDKLTLPLINELIEYRFTERPKGY